jgi:hypothetical protein
MHDPLRERDLSGRRKVRPGRGAGWMLHRTSQMSDGPRFANPARSTPQAVVIRFPPQTNAPQIGHNGGPRLAPGDPNESWRHYCWRRAHKAAWKTPQREIALRRLERAEALGMTYREYTLEILERGRHL